MTRAGKRKVSEEQKVGILFAQKCKIAGLENELAILKSSAIKFNDEYVKISADLARMKEGLEKIELETRPNGSMADRAVNEIATQALNHKEG